MSTNPYPFVYTRVKFCPFTGSLGSLILEFAGSSIHSSNVAVAVAAASSIAGLSEALDSIDRSVAAQHSSGDTGLATENTGGSSLPGPGAGNGSVKHALAGLPTRIEQDLSVARKFDELLLPTAFVQQRALPPRRGPRHLDNASRVNHVDSTNSSQTELGHRLKRKLSRGDLSARDDVANDQAPPPLPPLPRPRPPPPPPQQETPASAMAPYQAEQMGRAPTRRGRIAPPIQPVQRRAAPAAPERTRSAESSVVGPEEHQARIDLQEMLNACPPLPSPPRSRVHPALRRSWSFADLPALTMQPPPGVRAPGSRIPVAIASPRTRGPAVVRGTGIAAQTTSDLPLRAVSESTPELPPRNPRRLQQSASTTQLYIRGNAFAEAQARGRTQEPSNIPVRAHGEIAIPPTTASGTRQVRFDSTTAQESRTPRRRRAAPTAFAGAHTLSMVADEGDEPLEATEIQQAPGFATRNQIAELIRLGQAIEMPPTSTQLPRSEFDWLTGSERRRRGTDASAHGGSRLRQFARDVFTPHTDPLPQGEFGPRSPQSPDFPPNQPQELSRDSGGDRLSAELDNAINLWTQAAPQQKEQEVGLSSNRSSVYSQESYRHSISRRSGEDQLLRKEVGLEPLRNRTSPDQPKHPKHEYDFNTKKLMCWEVHTPRSPLLPPTATGPDPPGAAAAHAASYATGGPYDSTMYQRQQPGGPKKCASCESYCCHYGTLLVHSQLRISAYDIISRTQLRRCAQACEMLRVRKPNGHEEFETFLKCGQCEQTFCPRCVTLCTDALCRDIVCVRCVKEGEDGKCWIHNMI